MSYDPLLFEQPSKPAAMLYVLTQHLRLLSDAQAGRVWFPAAKDPRRMAQRTFRTLMARGQLALQVAMVHPELDLHGPLLDWRPGDVPPCLGRLAYRLKTRWHATPERALVARATRQARALFGAPLGGRPARACEIAHDLGLSTVFFRLLAVAPETPVRWRHEDELLRQGRFRPGEQIPDAVLTGEPEVVIEFGGEYPAQKLAVLHAAYQSGHYQIW